MTIGVTSKENKYSKQYVNYFQSWHMGTTNKLLQTALWERTAADNLKWPLLPIVTQWVKTAWHYYQIVQEVLFWGFE